MEKEYSVFEYLYRDASNYKVWGEFLLEGDVSADELATIRRNLEEGVYFIPEQIDVPALRDELYRYSSGPAVDDHWFHEFVCLREATEQEVKELSLWGSVSDFVARLRLANAG